ncbi:DNA topoisomerase IV subunit A [Segnochrobactrum spirostomi]|uniref:DNA topoisomerase 4 subunit A n=1 Tax=Segnochrobactrum spirostomi TaxID=2608987 RepID=A0A6A7Y5S9_9HYPH|nr:DNA topoisomerase IV subunit A [Segnochrobactrum spirostomi]MQT14590.1 DNA topoisomerase IV subunit A [Segnochrobactrum spirostomi]
MGKQVIPPGGEGSIESVDLREALEERYLAYALSTIMHRALPDVRDGMKPVHRRILHAMRQLRLDPTAAFKKCARVVGDVIGKYHPHGDQSVYDALVRLAQDFAVRYPLVDGQGNFGTLDGDSPAAMRYTEARLTDVGARLLEGIDDDAVDFRDTYDGSEQEPVVLPGAFPNLLANGSTGIAVGMATSIPPHNVAEIAEAALLLIRNPATDLDALLAHVKGPDFPTGGIIVESPGSIRESYRTGRGSFRVRARWESEDLGRGTWQIVVTEIPFQVQKGKLVERIAELLEAKKLPLLGDVRDESADDVRLVLEPRVRTVDPVLLMESLFRLSDLEVRVPLNMNVLVGGQVPAVIGLKEAIQHWLDHRKVVIVRLARHRLEKVSHRLEVLDGFLIVYLDLDRVIRIIREEDDPKAELIVAFTLTDVQAEAILNMRLRSLRRLEEMEIRKEHTALSAEKASLEALIADEKAQWKKVADEVKVLRKVYGSETPLGKRRTDFAAAPEAPTVDILEAMIEREPITIVVSELGWVRALKGHVQDLSTVAFKQGDALKWVLRGETTDKLLVLSTGGKVYTLGCDKLPGGRGHGEPIKLMVDMEQGQEVAHVKLHRSGGKVLIVSKEGRGFVAAEDDILANTRKGKQVLGVDEAWPAMLMVAVEGDMVATIGENRKLAIFPLSQVTEMTRGRGVRLQRYKDGGLSDVKTFSGADGLTWIDAGGRTHTRSLDDLKDWTSDRGAAGRLPPPGFPRTNRFA